MPPPFPTVTVNCAFASNPMSTPTWVNISTRAREFGVHRGRQFELDRVQTGTAQIRLSNQDRALDPNNAASTYFPNVIPMRRIKVEAIWNSTIYPVFTGFVEDWPQTWTLNGKLAEAMVPIVDGFAVFGYGSLSTTYPPGRSDERISAVLSDLNWGSGQAGIVGDPVFGLIGSTAIIGPVGDRAIGVGTANLQASTLAATFALEHMQSVTESENGRFFIARDGSATFMGRQLVASTSLATFGDAAGELGYSDLSLGSAPIWNDVRLTIVGGVEQTSSDATSQGQYFKRSRVQSGYLQSSDAEVGSLANFLVFKYKQPQTRVTSILIDPQRDPTNLWPQVLGREIGDVVTVKRRPPGGGAVISQLSVIEGIEHAATPYRWQTRFWLSTAETTNFAVVGTSLVGTGVVGY